MYLNVQVIIYCVICLRIANVYTENAQSTEQPKIVHATSVIKQANDRTRTIGIPRPPPYIHQIGGGYGVPGFGRISKPVDIPFLHKIDVVLNADYGGDDKDCFAHCKHGEFPCHQSCTCIEMSKRCDGIEDCAPPEDEAKCAKECDDDDNKSRCPNTGVCISNQWLCDGDNDCGDYSDETHCAGAPNCTTDQFECANGLCIHQSWVCDRDDDCKDNSDEVNCTRSKCTDKEFQCNSGQCISLHWKCDKEPDCIDATDETDCPAEILRCAEDEFQCTNKRCVQKDFQCDGDNDCKDWSDEDGCPVTPGNCNTGEFKCGDGKCIPARWRCDLEADCSDGGDENDCGPDRMRSCSSDEYTCSDRKCILKTWVCDGVPDCTNGEEETNCETTCEEDQYMCKQLQNKTISSAYRMCLNRKHVCDGLKDCPKGDDEEECPQRVSCSAEYKCSMICIVKHDGTPGCDCPTGYLVADDGISCRDIDECMYSQDPVCSQTCSNTRGSFRCGCMTGYVLRPDLRTCKATGVAPTLLFSNRLEIREVTLSSDKYISRLKGLHNAVALDYHYKKQMIFWTENSLNVIRMAKFDNPNGTDIIRWGLESPGGIAVDWIHDLLFWTDSGTRRVEVSSLDGAHRAVIAASDLDKPRAIAVHPGDALVFWTDWGPNPKIERSDMDGSNRKSIVVDEIFWPNGLTIDYTSSRIYWADAKHHVIECANFDGRERMKITGKGLPHPFALTLFEDAIYWTDWHTKSVSTVNKNTGAGLQHIHTGVTVPMDIHSFHPLRQPQYKNKCQRKNGGCSHLCLPNSFGYTCHCPLGYNLNSDGKTCEETPEKLLIFARKKDLRLKYLYPQKQSDSVDMVIPVENIKSAVALDWDHNTNSIFWTDVEKDTINRAFINGSQQKVIVRTNLVSPAGLAYDWIGNKLYWADSGAKRIEVANSDGTMRALLIWENIDKPRDIIVDPMNGLMYWSDWGTFPCIERAHMNGAARVKIITSNITWPNGLALDFAMKRIYWTDGSSHTIEYANLDGSGRTVLIGHDLPHPFGLDLHGEEIFWTDWESYSIQAANKNTGEGRRTLGAGITGLMDVRVFHKDRMGGINRCGNNNGGCSHLCILKPKAYVCACPTGIRLQEDSRTCNEGPRSYLIFAHRVDIRIISLDKEYLADVVLPLPPLKNALSLDVDKNTGFIYWTDTAVKKIQRVLPTGEKQQVIISNGIQTSDSLMIDSNGRKLYWTDGGRNTIEVSELNGTNRKTLIWEDLDSPRAIALDYDKGFLFWTDWGKNAKIERADMDGSNRKTIIDTDIVWPNGLAVDYKESRLYWCDAKLNRIESSDYNGNKREVFKAGVSYPYGIVIADTNIYWTDWKTKAIHRANKEEPFSNVTIRVQLEGLMDIRYVHVGDSLENKCGNNNGGCSHLCLRSQKDYSCACPTGISFEENSYKICKKIPNEFLVFATRNNIAIYPLDTKEGVDVTLPIQNVQNSIALDYHWEKRLLYYSDVDLDIIRCVNMLNYSDTKTVVFGQLKTPNGLGVDWIADNIYWTDNDHKVLEVARLDGTSRKVLISGLDEPRSLALFPRKGFVFWTDWGETPRIERAMLDGSQRKAIVTSHLGFPNGLTIDYTKKKLYWTDALKDKIDMSDLNGERRVQLIPSAKNPFGMTQFGEFIYWTDWYKKSIFRANKSNGQNITAIIDDLEMVMEIKAVAQSKQLGWNPCKEENGYCSHLCLFRATDYVCACPDLTDSRPCSKDPSYRVPLTFKPHLEYIDYDDINTGIGPTNTPSQRNEFSESFFIYGTFFILLILVVCAGFMIAARNFGILNRTIMKEEFDRGENDRHISFPNPNYNGTNGEQRANRFNIFKYDRTQERVTNVYVPEGASLLPTPPPPPAGNKLRRNHSEDFHTVTLHPIT